MGAGGAATTAEEVVVAAAAAAAAVAVEEAVEEEVGRGEIEEEEAAAEDMVGIEWRVQGSLTHCKSGVEQEEGEKVRGDAGSEEQYGADKRRKDMKQFRGDERRGSGPEEGTIEHSPLTNHKSQFPGGWGGSRRTGKKEKNTGRETGPLRTRKVGEGGFFMHQNNVGQECFLAIVSQPAVLLWVRMVFYTLHHAGISWRFIG